MTTTGSYSPGYAPALFKEHPTPGMLVAAHRAAGGDGDMRVFRSRNSQVFVSHDLCDRCERGPFWHLSISREDRIPTWDELHDARDQLLPPELWFVVHLPPAGDYVDVMPRCLHVWEQHTCVPGLVTP